MTALLSPYTAYKDSEVPWLGPVPQHWRRYPGLSLLAQKSVKNTGLAETRVLSLSHGRIVIKPPEKLHGLVPESFETYQVVDPGDIIVRSTDLQNDMTSLRVGLVRDRGIITSAYLCLQAKSELSAEYAFQFLHALDVMKVLYGLGSGLRQNLRFADFKWVPIYVPPPDEQDRIVRYLKSFDLLVQRFVATKQRLVKLLEEQRRAIIDRAVTKGIESSATLQPSGTPWLGEIPAHWEVLSGKRLFSVRKELARPDDVQLSATQAYGVIPQAEFEAKVGRRVVKISLHLEKRRHVEKDDFVISMRSFQGGLERAWASGAIRSSYVVLRPGSAVDVDFFTHVLKSPGFIRSLQSGAEFIRDGQDLTFDDFCKVDLPVPPLHEQVAIARAIGDALTAIDAEATKLRRELELIREFRSRLVVDVVTGKRDVRKAAEALPDVRALEELHAEDFVLPDEDAFGTEDVDDLAELEANE